MTAQTSTFYASSQHLLENIRARNGCHGNLGYQRYLNAGIGGLSFEEKTLTRGRDVSCGTIQNEPSERLKSSRAFFSFMLQGSRTRERSELELEIVVSTQIHGSVHTDIKV